MTPGNLQGHNRIAQHLLLIMFRATTDAIEDKRDPFASPRFSCISCWDSLSFKEGMFFPDSSCLWSAVSLKGWSLVLLEDLDDEWNKLSSSSKDASLSLITLLLLMFVEDLFCFTSRCWSHTILVDRIAVRHKTRDSFKTMPLLFPNAFLEKEILISLQYDPLPDTRQCSLEREGISWILFMMIESWMCPIIWKEVAIQVLAMKTDVNCNLVLWADDTTKGKDVTAASVYNFSRLERLLLPFLDSFPDVGWCCCCCFGSREDTFLSYLNTFASCRV